MKTPSFTRVAGSDVSTRSLQYAARRLHLDRMSERQAERVQLFQGALTYEDERYAGFDAAVLMEVVEHVDPPGWRRWSASCSVRPSRVRSS